MSQNWQNIARIDEVEEDDVICVKVGALSLALYNIDGEYYVTDNECTHAQSDLSEGYLDGDVIECPLHQGCFEVKTGKAIASPATIDLKTYQTRVEGGHVQIVLE